MTDTDFEEAPAPDDKSLKRVSALATRQLQLEREIEEAEAALAAKVAAHRAVSETDLPAAMAEVGLRSFVLSNSATIKIATVYQANVPTADRVKDPEKRAALLAKRTAWFSWLRKNGHDAIIKRDVEVQFGKGEAKLAERLVAYVAENFGDQKLVDRETVNTGTLQALVREQIEKHHVEFPPELGVQTVRIARIERAED